MCCNVHKTSEKYVWIQQHSKVSNSFLAPKELSPLKTLAGMFPPMDGHAQNIKYINITLCANFKSIEGRQV